MQRISPLFEAIGYLFEPLDVVDRGCRFFPAAFGKDNIKLQVEVSVVIDLVSFDDSQFYVFCT